MLKYFIKIMPLVFLGALLWSCEDDLNITPEDNRLTDDRALVSESDYTAFLAKIYGGLSLFDQGSGSDPDISTIRADFSGYMRLYFQMQELPTDEAVIAWNDGPIQALNTQTWSSGDSFPNAMYARVFFQVAQANEFLRQSEQGALASKGLNNETLFKGFRAEARFLRALSYWHGLDLFGNTTFVTENDGTGSPPQISKAELFSYIESELLAIENEIAGPKENQYGRADRGAVWALLAKLYLNAEVYLGEGNGRFDDCIVFCNKIINAGYSIDTSLPYQNLFLADNDKNGAQSEAIFTIPHDGINTKSSGGFATFVVHAAVGDPMNPTDFGIGGGWGGLRTTSVLVDLYGTPTGQEEVFNDAGSSLGFQEIWSDQRLLTFTAGQSKVINDITFFNDGYAITKFKNITSDGQPGKDPSENPDLDFHMFRLADIYLTYAEATLEGGAGGNINTAVGYINTLRERANGGAAIDNIAIADLTNDFIIDERGRELYWECHRRTDLIRHKQFSENGIWPFKGGVPAGQVTPKFRNLYPIPQNELDVNTNPLVQNPGY